jgi:hypothetical protein
MTFTLDAQVAAVLAAAFCTQRSAAGPAGR